MKEDDNFEEEYDAWFDETDEEKEIRNEFVDALSGKLFDMALHHHPDMPEKKDDELRRKLQVACIKSSHQVFDCFNFVKDDYLNNRESKQVANQPHRNNRETAAKELAETKKRLEPGLAKEYEKVFWESYEESIPYDNFDWAIHNKMKEVLVDFFFDDISNFESSHLLKTDQYCYYNGMMGFNELLWEIIREEEEQSKKKE